MLKKSLQACGAAVLSTTLLFGQGLTTTQESSDWEEINFAFNSAVLTDGYPSLLRLAELLNQNADYRVRLEGHADSLGADPYNIDLALERAEAVRDFLVQNGAQANQVSIESLGEQSPTADNDLDEGRFMNRRVTITVTDAQGNVISDQGAVEAIAALAEPAQEQDECCEPILRELERLEEIRAALEALQDENQGLQDEIEQLTEAQRTLEDRIAAAPTPATEDQVREVVREEIPEPSDKFARYSLLAGTDTDTNNLAVSGSGQVFLPFAGTHAVQAQGEYMHGFRRNEGQIDIGLLNRFGSMQAGIFSSFKYVKFGDFTHAGALGQAAGTLGYIFPRGRIGVFGTKGFLDGSVIHTRRLATHLIEETSLSIVDQLGFSATVAAWSDSWFEGNLGAQFGEFAGRKAGGRIRYIHPITNHIAFTVAGGLNETLVSSSNTGSFTLGLEFGQWLNPRDYGEAAGPVPVDVPRIRYETRTRTVRTGNDAPVADAGPDQTGVQSGIIVLDGSRSSDPDGDPITFVWEQESGPAVTLSAPHAAQTSFSAGDGQTYRFRLTVKDDRNRTGIDHVMVSTLDPRITVLRFSAEPLRIAAGEAATLLWEVRNATNVEISGIGEVDPEGGSTTVSPAETTTYVLTASNPERTVMQSVTITVEQQDPPIIVNFSATPTMIWQGYQSILSWEVRNATEITISGIGPVAPLRGSIPVSPAQTTEYTITVRNRAGEASATVKVTVGD